MSLWPPALRAEPDRSVGLTARLAASFLIVLLWGEPAFAGPAIAAALPGLAAFAGTALGSVVIQVGLAAAAYGIEFLLTRNARRQQDAENAPGVRVPQRAGLLERRLAYGSIAVSGGVFFQKTVADGGSTNPDVLVIGLALSEGLCDSVGGLIVNGVDCELDVDGTPATAPWNSGGDYLKVAFRQGADDQAIDTIVDDRFSEDAAFRQRGVATAVIEMLYGDDADHHTELWGVGGVPDIKFRLSGRRVYDPRDAAQDVADPDTWAFSRNATLIIADWLMHEFGFGIDPGDIDWPSVRDSADVDDQRVATLDGSEPRGTIDGVVFASEANDDVLSAMLSANRALVRWSGGKWSIRADRAEAPVATLHQGLLAGEFAYRNEVDERQALNTVHCRFAPAVNNHEPATVDFVDSSLVSADGREYDTTIGLPFTSSPSAAQRLGYAVVADNRVARSFTGQFDIAVLVAAGKTNQTLEAGDVVRLEFADYPNIGGLYRVTSLEVNGDFTVSVGLTGYTAEAISGWSVNEENAFQSAA